MQSKYRRIKKTASYALTAMLAFSLLPQGVSANKTPEFYWKVSKEGEVCSVLEKEYTFEEQDSSLLPSATNSKYDTQEFHSGNASLMLSGSESAEISFQTSSYPLTGGALYTLSVWIKIENLTNAQDAEKAYVNVHPGDLTNMGYNAIKVYETGGQWKQVEFKDCQLPNVTANYRMKFTLPAGTTGNVWIDDITVTKVKEPGEKELTIKNYDFWDVPSSFWAYESIANLYNNGIISGKNEYEFDPDGYIKREEFAKIAVLASLDVKSKNKGTFSDVNSGSWYEEYVETAAENTLVEGKGDSIFGVGENITRQDAAVILDRILTLKGIAPEKCNYTFADDAQIAQYAKGAVYNLYAKGLLENIADATFNPTTPITRAEVCAVIDRMNIVRNRHTDIIYRTMPETQAPYEILFEEHFDEKAIIEKDGAEQNAFTGDEGNLKNGSIGVADGEYAPFEINIPKGGNQSSISLTYRVNIKSNLDDMGSVILKVSTLKPDGSVSRSSSEVKITGSTGGWIEKTLTVTENNEFSGAKLYVRFENAQYGDVYFDDVMITSAKHPLIAGLLVPNYKGLIYEPNGENDIVLQTWVEKDYVKEAIEDVKICAEIFDKEDFIVLSSENAIVEKRMCVTFSSKYLDYGDYILKVSLKSKIDGREIDSVSTILRKREGSITDLKSYIDKDGVFVNNGKRELVMAMYGYAFPNTYQFDLLEGSAVDKVLSYWAGTNPVYSEEYLDYTGDKGLSISAPLRIFKGRTDIVVNSIPEERERIEIAVNTLKDNPNIWCWYLHDEPNTYQIRDVLRWHNEIINTLDLNRPTYFVDNKYSEVNGFTHNFSASAMGEDNYTIKFNENDSGVGRQAGFVRSLRKGFINKPIWHALQMYNATIHYGGNDPTWRCPSEQQQRNMVMQSICNGATGISWYALNYTMSDFAGEDGLELLSRTLNASRDFKELEDIILSPEEPPTVKTTGGDWLDCMAKRYEGKTYLFLGNHTINPQKAVFKIEGAKSATDIFTGKTYNIDKFGIFEVELDNIEIAVLEIEQNDYLSNDCKIKNVSFYNGERSYMTRNTDEGSIVDISDGAKEICYEVMCNEKATLFINGKECDKKGTVSGDILEIKLVSEDGKCSETLNITVNRE